MIKKMVETWHRVIAGELPEALDGLLADDASSTRRSWRNQADGAVTVLVQQHERDATVVQIASHFKSVRDARFAVRDMGARCRSGCQGG